MQHIWGGSDEPRTASEYKTEYMKKDTYQRRAPFKPDNEYKAYTGAIQDETTHK